MMSIVVRRSHAENRSPSTLCSLLVAVSTFLGPWVNADDVPTQKPAELVRKNGFRISVPSIVSVRGGTVTALSPKGTAIKPLSFRSGEISAILFEESTFEPDINGNSRLKFFYQTSSKSFEQHKILVTISRWNVSQNSTEQQVEESNVSRDSSGNIIIEKSMKTKVIYAPTAELSATFANKESEPVTVSYELRINRIAVRTGEVMLDGEESKDVVITIPTGGDQVQEVVISDVYNRITGK